MASAKIARDCAACENMARQARLIQPQNKPQICIQFPHTSPFVYKKKCMCRSTDLSAQMGSFRTKKTSPIFFYFCQSMFGCCKNTVGTSAS